MGDEALYQKMMTSPGGVMLLVRLGADLGLLSKPDLERLSVPEGAADLEHRLPESSRLRVTIEWLDRQFGRTNRMRAVVEVAADVLQSRTGTKESQRDSVSA